MNQNKFISFFKIAFNPFRIISLFFLYISRFFGFFADLFDGLTGEINTNLNIAENNIENKVKKVYISDKVGKLLIFFLLVLLFFIWSDYLIKGIL